MAKCYECMPFWSCDNKDKRCERNQGKMKVYIAGAITKNPNYMQQFSHAEKRLTAMGHAVINPVKNEGFSYKEYIDMGLCELMRCDAIYLLPGWRESFGARLEYHYATITGMAILGALEDKPKGE